MSMHRISSEQHIQFVVPGRPCCKGAPNNRRVLKRLDESGAMTADGYKTLIRLCALNAIAERGGWEYTRDSAFYVLITIYLGPGCNTSKAIQDDMYKGRRLPVREPRVDNIAKYILDSLLGICWERKSQVVGMLVAKKYVKKRQSVEVLIGNPKSWRELNNDLRNA